MTQQLISLAILFFYFGILAKGVQFFCKKIFQSTFNELGQKSTFTAVLVIPALLLIPLSNSFYETSLMTSFFDFTALLGRQALQIAFHLAASIVGLIVLTILGRIFIATHESEESDSTGILIGLILMSIIIALILFPFLSATIADIVPKQEIQGFR